MIISLDFPLLEGSCGGQTKHPQGGAPQLNVINFISKTALYLWRVYRASQVTLGASRLAGLFTFGPEQRVSPEIRLRIVSVTLSL